MESALVVSVAGAWGLSEMFGWPHSTNEPPGRGNTKFYASYTLAHIAGALLVIFSVDPVQVAVDVEILNAMLLPLVLGCLLALETPSPTSSAPADHCAPSSPASASS